MPPIDSLARGFLFFSQDYTVITVLLIGFFSPYRKHFIKIGLLASACVVINTALKAYFKVPLNPNIHHFGYAFPSGHMQFATLFWGAIALEFKNLKTTLPLLLLPGIGWGLVHFDYHTFADVIAGVISGLLVLGLSHQCGPQKKRFLAVFFIITSAALIYDTLNYLIIPRHAIYAYIAFLGLTLFAALLPLRQSGGILKD